MRLNSILGAIIFAGIGGAGVTGAARAADMAPAYAPSVDYGESEQPLEFGSGWYLRGDATFSEEDRPKLNAAGLDASFNGNTSDFGYGFGGGFGYKFNSFLRADITGDYLDPLKYDADLPCGSACAATLQTKFSRWDGLVNGYVDLGTWFGLTPYVGAGVGVAAVQQDASFAVSGGPVPAAFTDPRTGTVVTENGASRTSYQFAWAAMAGFSYAVAPHMLIDVGYRYLDLGRASIPLSPVGSVTKDLASQQVRVGVRYVID